MPNRTSFLAPLSCALALASLGLGQAPATPAPPQSRPASAPAEGRITEAEREKALALLARAAKETHMAIDGLTDAQWAFKPAPDKWSIGEVLEHIVLVEEARAAEIARRAAEKAEADWATKRTPKDEFLEKALLNRDMKVKAPESVVPSGKLARAETVKRYDAARAKSKELAAKPDLLLKGHFVAHPFFGNLSAYQEVLVLGFHNLRHNQQIAEVKTAAGYPAAR